MPPDSEAQSFTLWSGLERWAFHHRGSVYLWSILALSAAFVYSARRAGATAPAIGLVSMALLDMGVSTLADVLDPIRHLLLFRTMFDFMAVATAACIGAAPGPPRREVRRPGGPRE
jgi:hypothetical protein